MKISILGKKRKVLNSLVNGSFITFALLWSIIFWLLVFNYQVTEVISEYLMLASAPPLVLAAISSGILVLSKRNLEVNEQEEFDLIINISEEDFSQNRLNSMGYCSNFVIFKDSNTEIEISSAQVKKLLSQNNPQIKCINFQQKQTRMLEDSPKEIIHSALMMLWAAS